MPMTGERVGELEDQVTWYCRWGRTPLQDAVAAGHVSIAEEIYTRGGNMSATTGPVEICNAATEGDVRHLRLLHRCGVDPGEAGSL